MLGVRIGGAAVHARVHPTLPGPRLNPSSYPPPALPPNPSHHSNPLIPVFSAFAGYAAGLVATIVVMNVFDAAQPALLYIVPAVLGAVGAAALARGEVAAVLGYSEEEEEEEEKDGAKKKSPAKKGTPAKKRE